MQEEKISVVVPVYNIKKYLERCISSLTNQTYHNIEICIVDDGSTDGSEIICDELATQDDRIKVFHQENSGPSIARNKGLDMSTGDYIFFLDSDDYIKSETFSFLLDEMKKNNADISCCAARRVDENGIDSPYLEEKEYLLNREQALEHCMFRNTIGSVVWAKLYKKKLFYGVRFPEHKNAEDEFVVYRLVANSDLVIYTGKYMYCYFEYSEGLCATGKNYVCMWYFEAWCQREEYLRKNGYIRLADMTIEKMIRTLYEKRNDIENKAALVNSKKSVKYVLNRIIILKQYGIISKIKMFIKAFIVELSLMKYNF